MFLELCVSNDELDLYPVGNDVAAVRRAVVTRSEDLVIGTATELFPVVECRGSVSRLAFKSDNPERSPDDEPLVEAVTLLRVLNLLREETLVE
jgi:hypothetical protein